MKKRNNVKLRKKAKVKLPDHGVGKLPDAKTPLNTCEKL